MRFAVGLWRLAVGGWWLMLGGWGQLQTSLDDGLSRQESTAAAADTIAHIATAATYHTPHGGAGTSAPSASAGTPPLRAPPAATPGATWSACRCRTWHCTRPTGPTGPRDSPRGTGTSARPRRSQGRTRPAAAPRRRSSSRRTSRRCCGGGWTGSLHGTGQVRDGDVFPRSGALDSRDK